MGELWTIQTLSFCSWRASTSICAFFKISSTNSVIWSIFCGSSQNSAIRTFNGMWFGLDKSKLICLIRKCVSVSTGSTFNSNLALKIFKYLLFSIQKENTIPNHLFSTFPSMMTVNSELNLRRKNKQKKPVPFCCLFFLRRINKLSNPRRKNGDLKQAYVV